MNNFLNKNKIFQYQITVGLGFSLNVSNLLYFKPIPFCFSINHHCGVLLKSMYFESIFFLAMTESMNFIPFMIIVHVFQFL